MAKRGRKAKAEKQPKQSKRAKFEAPVNTKTGKAGAAALETSEAAKPSEVRHLTPAATLKSLLRTCSGLKQNADNIIGKLREEIAYAKDKKHLHTGAFAMLRKFDKMEAERAADLFDTFMAYMDSSGVMAKIEAVGRLPFEGEEGEPPRATPTKDKTGGARKPRVVEEPVQQEADSEDHEAQEAAQQRAANGGGAIGSGGEVSRPHFGQRPAAAAPGGPVHMLPDAAAGGSKH